MLDSIADGDAERKQEDLGDSKEGSSENNITNGPPVVQCSENEGELGDDVDYDADEGPEDVDDPETDGFLKIEAGKPFEGGDCYEE